jgi:hypothetical protein
LFVREKLGDVPEREEREAEAAAVKWHSSPRGVGLHFVISAAAASVKDER